MIASLINCEQKLPCGQRPIEQRITAEDAKEGLARATAPADRKRAVAKAIEAGMPLYEIEEFLDWADAARVHRAFELSVGFGSASQSHERTETTEFVFVLPNDQARIPPVVEFLATEAARVAETNEMEQMRLSLALEEAVVNALYHGNLEIASDSNYTEQICRHDVAERRRNQQPFCNRRIRILASINRIAAAFVIRDEGRGFDPSRLPDPTDDANLGRCCGRGVYLMRSLMDEVIFNEIGNEVTMVRRWAA